MNLNPIKANMTELILNDWRILFSYRTPVAAQDRHTKMNYRTQIKWSVTTTRHINQWLSGFDAVETRPQEFFDELVK